MIIYIYIYNPADWLGVDYIPSMYTYLGSIGIVKSRRYKGNNRYSYRIGSYWWVDDGTGKYLKPAVIKSIKIYKQLLKERNSLCV